jgi:hypothetical protein
MILANQMNLEDVNEVRKRLGLPPLNQEGITRRISYATKKSEDKRPNILDIRSSREEEHSRYTDWLYLKYLDEISEKKVTASTRSGLKRLQILNNSLKPN